MAKLHAVSRWEDNLLVVYDNLGVYYGCIAVFPNPHDPEQYVVDDGGVFMDPAPDKPAARKIAKEFGRRMVDAYN